MNSPHSATSYDAWKGPAQRDMTAIAAGGRDRTTPPCHVGMGRSYYPQAGRRLELWRSGPPGLQLDDVALWIAHVNHLEITDPHDGRRRDVSQDRSSVSTSSRTACETSSTEKAT
jgi:hypothetical protein